MNIQILYFLLFHCFSEGKSINQSFIECKEFSEKLDITNITIASISKVFNLLRIKIRENMHKEWAKNLLGEAICEKGYAIIEIDESEIVGNSNDIFWMFGIICRKTKDARVYCVLTNRTKQKLLPIIKDNVITDSGEEDNLEEINSVKTRIFSDCFSSYQTNDFKDLGFILKKVNHSIWFGFGSFHTNTVESLWSNIKKNANNFAGISIDNLKKNFNNNEKMITKYLDGWITYSLLLRDFMRKRLSWSQRSNYLIHYLKIA